MSIAATQAAMTMESEAEFLTPHKVIQLLLDGALERLEQASLQLRCGNTDEAGQLMTKAVGILSGLQESLDFDRGGEMAVQLDNLYRHMIGRLLEAEEDTGEFILAESIRALRELKSGWDSITPVRL